MKPALEPDTLYIIALTTLTYGGSELKHGMIRSDLDWIYLGEKKKKKQFKNKNYSILVNP